MFHSFRIKIVMVIMSIFSIVIVSVLIAIYVMSYHRSQAQTEFLLKRLSNNNGVKYIHEINNRYITQRTRDVYEATSFYSVFVGYDQSILRISNDSNSGYTNDELSALAVSLIQKGDLDGKTAKLSYAISYKENGILIVFVNYSQQLSYLESLLYNMLLIGLIGILLLFVLSVWLSKWLILPIETAFARHRQFISDASHELKTPVTIISSNADALLREIGDNKWVGYIHLETRRMNLLITDLLTLAKIDVHEERMHFSKFNLSEAVTGTVLPFESIAFEKSIHLNEQIEADLFMNGSSTQLIQLVTILVDNALNYTETGGFVNVTLSQHRDQRVLLVSNTVLEIPLEQRQLIFERFYRTDEARSRASGGYGLGLSIAKAIVENHGGKISVNCENGWIIFTVIL